MAKNNDDHIKNISFLMDKPENIMQDDFKAVAERVGFHKYAAVIDQVENAVVYWNEVAKDCGVRKNHREEIAQELFK